MTTNDEEIWRRFEITSSNLLTILPPRSPFSIQFSPQIVPLDLSPFDRDSIIDHPVIRKCTKHAQSGLLAIVERGVNDLEESLRLQYSITMTSLAATFQGEDAEIPFKQYASALATRTRREYSLGVEKMTAELIAEVQRCLALSRAPPVRATLSVERVSILEAAYLRKDRLSTAEKNGLASATGLEPRQVSVWFANQRQRRGKKLKEKPYPSTKTRPPILPAPRKTAKRQLAQIRIADIWSEKTDVEVEEQPEEEWEDEREMQIVIEEEKDIKPIIIASSPSAPSPSSSFYCSPPPEPRSISAAPNEFWSTPNMQDVDSDDAPQFTADSYLYQPSNESPMTPLFDIRLRAYASSAYVSSSSSLSEYDYQEDLNIIQDAAHGISTSSDHGSVPQFSMSSTWALDGTTPKASTFHPSTLQRYSSYDDLSQEQKRDMMLGVGEQESWSKIMGRTGLVSEGSLTLEMEVDAGY